VPIVLKSVSVNLLEPSGPVKVFNGIALPLPFTLSLQVLVNMSESMLMENWSPRTENLYCLKFQEQTTFWFVVSVAQFTYIAANGRMILINWKG
jgi:hypothetical protein